MHGGLTAAIVDESFGGLLFALKQAGGLGFWGPAYTVNLEVGGWVWARCSGVTCWCQLPLPASAHLPRCPFMRACAASRQPVLPLSSLLCLRPPSPGGLQGQDPGWPHHPVHHRGGELRGAQALDEGHRQVRGWVVVRVGGWVEVGGGQGRARRTGGRVWEVREHVPGQQAVGPRVGHPGCSGSGSACSRPLLSQGLSMPCPQLRGWRRAPLHPPSVCAARARCNEGGNMPLLLRLLMGMRLAAPLPACSDGPKGQVYATARALFVAPKPHKMVQDVGKYLLRRLVGDM